MINELNKHITKNNSKLVNYLSSLITYHKINNLRELQDYENKAFTINGKELTKQEKIKYATEIAFRSFYDYDSVEDASSHLIYKLKLSLDTDISDEEKIYNIIKLFDLTGKKCYFLVDAYNLIVQDKYL